MSGGEIGALGGIIVTLVTGLYGTWRLAKADRWKGTADQSAVLLAGWKDLQQSISAEVERVKKSCAEEIAKLKADFEVDRQEWCDEKAVMQEEIEMLKAQVAALALQLQRPRTTRSRRADQ